MFHTTNNNAATAAPAPPGVFVFERRNRAYLDGTSQQVRLRPPNITGLGFFLMFVLLFILAVVAFTGGYDVARWLLTRNGAVTTQARVVDRWTSRGRTISYRVAFAFTVADTPYRVTQQVSRDLYLRIESTAEIRYWPADPRMAVLAGQYEEPRFIQSGATLMLIPGGLGVIILVVLYNFALERRQHSKRQARLRTEGRVIYGTVVRSNGRERRKAGYEVTVHYVFRTPEARLVTTSEQRIMNWMRRKPLPAADTPVAILYADQHTCEML
jgi:hypothetical protein